MSLNNYEFDLLNMDIEGMSPFPPHLDEINLTASYIDSYGHLLDMTDVAHTATSASATTTSITIKEPTTTNTFDKASKKTTSLQPRDVFGKRNSTSSISGSDDTEAQAGIEPDTSRNMSTPAKRIMMVINESKRKLIEVEKSLADTKQRSITQENSTNPWDELSSDGSEDLELTHEKPTERHRQQEQQSKRRYDDREVIDIKDDEDESYAEKRTKLTERGDFISKKYPTEESLKMTLQRQKEDAQKRHRPTEDPQFDKMLTYSIQPHFNRWRITNFKQHVGRFDVQHAYISNLRLSLGTNFLVATSYQKDFRSHKQETKSPTPTINYNEDSMKNKKLIQENMKLCRQLEETNTELNLQKKKVQVEKERNQNLQETNRTEKLKFHNAGMAYNENITQKKAKIETLTRQISDLQDTFKLVSDTNLLYLAQMKTKEDTITQLKHEIVLVPKGQFEEQYQQRHKSMGKLQTRNDLRVKAIQYMEKNFPNLFSDLQPVSGHMLRDSVKKPIEGTNLVFPKPHWDGYMEHKSSPDGAAIEKIFPQETPFTSQLFGIRK